MESDRLSELLGELLSEIGWMDEEDRRASLATDVSELGECQTRSFEEAGLLTMNDGLLVRTADGREFQLTIVRSA